LAGPWVAIICVLVSGFVNAEARQWCNEAIQFVADNAVQRFGSRIRKNSGIGSESV
jgi:hypothetical protein